MGAVAVWMLEVDTDIRAATTVYVIAAVGSLAVAAMLGWRCLSEIRAAGVGHSPDGEAVTRSAILLSGGHLALVSLGFVIGQNLSVLMTGIIAGPEDVAVVRVAARVAEIAGLLRAIAVMQYRPMMAEAYGKRNMVLLQNHVSTLAVIFTVTGLPITLGLWVFAEEAMGIFGPGFTEGAWALRLYVLGVFITMMCGPCTVVLTLCDGEKFASQVVWLALLVNFVLSIPLIYAFGFLGAAIAFLCSMLVLSVTSVRTSRRVLGIDTTIVQPVRMMVSRLFGRQDSKF
jgi:O-antigen/teichoic acid export membrane protein